MGDRKVWGVDEEKLPYETEGEALEALDNAACLEAGQSYWSADAVPVDPAKYLIEGIDRFLEDADESMAEDVGLEDPVFEVGAEAIAELEALLKAWADKHIPAGYWMADNLREHKVTFEQVAELRKENSDG